MQQFLVLLAVIAITFCFPCPNEFILNMKEMTFDLLQAASDISLTMFPFSILIFPLPRSTQRA